VIAEVASGSYFEGMRAVGIKTLKNRLSEYVRLAAAGETVLISDRDRVVAQLGPPEAGRSGAISDTLLADAVRQGLVTPASLPPGEPPPAPPGLMPLEQLLAELDRSREDR
jgi:antitoxin (DNA-binding transcriptional repressor) of toxin-antitoxin stability system